MFKNIFSFDGRIRRTEFGVSFIIYAVAYVIISALISAGGQGGAIIGLVILIPMLWFLLAQGAKRCHDRGNSGWFQLIPFYVLWLIFAEGDHNENEYGFNPKN